MGKKVAELNTLSDGKGITGIRFLNEMEDTNESTNLRKLAGVWMSKNRCCRGIATEALSASLESLLTSDIPVKKKKKSIHIVSGAKFAAINVRFHQTPRSQNHQSRVPNLSRASIAAAQPLKHVETRKNEVLNSTKTKQFCRNCEIENHRHAQKLFVIIVASGLECSVIVLCAQ